MGSGRTPRITPELTEAVCADIRRGCFDKVAAARHGVNHYTHRCWCLRGQREAETRAAEDTEDEPSVYETYWLAVEQAQAEARYVAETRVWETAPQWWLARGYAKVDWRNSDQLARMVEQAVDQRIRAILDAHDRQQQCGADWRAQHAELERLQAEEAALDAHDRHPVGRCLVR